EEAARLEARGPAEVAGVDAARLTHDARFAHREGGYHEDGDVDALVPVEVDAGRERELASGAGLERHQRRAVEDGGADPDVEGGGRRQLELDPGPRPAGGARDHHLAG